MTSLWILSDLHLRAGEDLRLQAPPHDVAVLAGDVDERLCRRVLPWLRDRFPGPVVYVPGNHDFWKTTYQTEVAEARELAAAAGVTLLVEGETAVLAGTRFVGATLWTDWGIRPDLRALAMDAARGRVGGMNDVRRIKSRQGPRDYNQFHPGVSGRLHAAQRARIEAALALPFEGPTVVVTHHAPHERSLRGGAWSEPLDAAYASDLSAILEGPTAPALWVHGHVHESRDYCVGGTRVVANPRGYAGEATGFDPGLVVEV
ncbi:metallophosphoesterase [Methylobacterium sp. Leaf90]|nr:metallophosphoesterase [Methylobacterium sp. Leaf90]